VTGDGVARQHGLALAVVRSGVCMDEPSEDSCDSMSQSSSSGDLPEAGNAFAYSIS